MSAWVGAFLLRWCFRRWQLHRLLLRAVPKVVASHLEVGSVGHPHSCAEACRYVKRKGGCRDGESCTKCHLCFWRRQPASATLGATVPSLVAPRAVVAPVDVAAAPTPPVAPVVAQVAAGPAVEVPPSLGTLGHPRSCGPPCRYVRRKGGCRDGVDCTSCHACLWQRERKDEAHSEVDPGEPLPSYVPLPWTATVAASAGLVAEPVLAQTVGVFGEASVNLQSLIVALLVECFEGAPCRRTAEQVSRQGYERPCS